jgi:hypothetical protein
MLITSACPKLAKMTGLSAKLPDTLRPAVETTKFFFSIWALLLLEKAITPDLRNQMHKAI